MGHQRRYLLLPHFSTYTVDGIYIYIYTKVSYSYMCDHLHQRHIYMQRRYRTELIHSYILAIAIWCCTDKINELKGHLVRYIFVSYLGVHHCKRNSISIPGRIRLDITHFLSIYHEKIVATCTLITSS